MLGIVNPKQYILLLYIFVLGAAKKIALDAATKQLSNRQWSKERFFDKRRSSCIIRRPARQWRRAPIVAGRQQTKVFTGLKTGYNLESSFVGGKREERTGEEDRIIE